MLSIQNMQRSTIGSGSIFGSIVCWASNTGALCCKTPASCTKKCSFSHFYYSDLFLSHFLFVSLSLFLPIFIYLFFSLSFNFSFDLFSFFIFMTLFAQFLSLNNRIFFKIISLMPLPCRHSDLGCTEELYRDLLTVHEDCCKFRYHISELTLWQGFLHAFAFYEN